MNMGDVNTNLFSSYYLSEQGSIMPFINLIKTSVFFISLKFLLVPAGGKPYSLTPKFEDVILWRIGVIWRKNSVLS